MLSVRNVLRYKNFLSVENCVNLRCTFYVQTAERYLIQSWVSVTISTRIILWNLDCFSMSAFWKIIQVLNCVLDFHIWLPYYLKNSVMNKPSCILIDRYMSWWSGVIAAYAISEPRVVVCQLRWISDNGGFDPIPDSLW